MTSIKRQEELKDPLQHTSSKQKFGTGFSGDLLWLLHRNKQGTQRNQRQSTYLQSSSSGFSDSTETLISLPRLVGLEKFTSKLLYFQLYRYNVLSELEELHRDSMELACEIHKAIPGVLQEVEELPPQLKTSVLFRTLLYDQYNMLSRHDTVRQPTTRAKKLCKLFSMLRIEFIGRPVGETSTSRTKANAVPRVFLIGHAGDASERGYDPSASISSGASLGIFKDTEYTPIILGLKKPDKLKPFVKAMKQLEVRWNFTNRRRFILWKKIRKFALKLQRSVANIDGELASLYDGFGMKNVFQEVLDGTAQEVASL
ncbi:hypothetical protein BJ508DRAFT_179359 [Ascobolus immersus RN42]|uniref:Uncharacterized protein n=1 Tax=Ascobolus immersus RN42 TaxID=1160509 RepID=A0A3N4HT00_ASCIM|nr:hypothetical protein BJ508DRAFT_179359 [Ascobolus immersus RN42]